MVELRECQEQALASIEEVFVRTNRALVVMASGLGKTVLAAVWAEKRIERGRILFLCHENGILEQALGEFKEVIGEKATYGFFHGQTKDCHEVDVLFASFQTFKDWKEAFYKDEFMFIVVDESHHGQAPTYKEVIEYFEPKELLGVTATPDREDEKDIRDIFGEEVVNFSLEEGIAKGWLTSVEYEVITDNLNSSALRKMVRDVLKRGERISLKQLNETIFIKARDEEVAKIIRNKNEGRKTIIFCENIFHANNFQQFLPGSEVYHSGRSYLENKKTLDDFRNGSLKYILAVDKFNEGIDVPDTEMVVFLRCTDSKTVFLQQLGRGLRKIPSKEKVVVLDFVANCERLAMVREMAFQIKEQLNGGDIELSKRLLCLSGDAFNFVFSSEQMDIFDVIARIKAPFYETWQEASRVAIRLKVRSRKDYQKKYKQDPSLLCNPDLKYCDFPGWKVFLEKFYLTWQEASEAAIGLKVEGSKDYQKKYKQDPKLPSEPRRYDDFPGWYVFLGQKGKGDLGFYPTWQEASRAAIKLKIASGKSYKKKYKQDSRLIGDPNKKYDDFPGWYFFLGQKGRDVSSYYPTWQESSEAAIRLGAGGKKDYRKKYKQDFRLPSSPDQNYDNFPGWRIFLGKE